RSVDRKIPLWCCTHNVSGAVAHWTTRCASCAFGSYWSSGGIYSARIPLPPMRHDLPPSRVVQAPPVYTPITMSSESLGFTQMEWRPGYSAPPPLHCSRSGSSHIDRFSAHELPPSSDLERPPGIVPHQSTPGRSVPPSSSAQIRRSVQSIGFPLKLIFGTYPSGIGGYVGAPISVHVAPPSCERCS